MSRADNLGTLPFSDYADPDPNGQLRIGDEEPPLTAGELFADRLHDELERPLPCPHLYRDDWYGGRRCWSCQEVRP